MINLTTKERMLLEDENLMRNFAYQNTKIMLQRLLAKS